jgi:hypothetical protein
MRRLCGIRQCKSKVQGQKQKKSVELKDSEAQIHELPTKQEHKTRYLAEGYDSHSTIRSTGKPRYIVITQLSGKCLSTISLIVA